MRTTAKITTAIVEVTATWVAAIQPASGLVSTASITTACAVNAAYVIALATKRRSPAG